MALGCSVLAALMALLGAVSIHHLAPMHTEFDTVMQDHYPTQVASMDSLDVLIKLLEKQ